MKYIGLVDEFTRPSWESEDVLSELWLCECGTYSVVSGRGKSRERQTCRACVRNNRGAERAARVAEAVARSERLRAVASAARPTQRRAIRAVRVALVRGVLKRPDACSLCAKKRKRVEAHHDDYAKPLDVRWLCSPCHKREHIRLRNEGRDPRALLLGLEAA